MIEQQDGAADQYDHVTRGGIVGSPAGEAQMREPVFTQVMQIGIVGRDLDAAIQQYVDEYGIGPRQRHEELTPTTPGTCGFTASRPRSGASPPRRRRVAAAAAMIDQVMWELIEPLDDESVFERFLAEKGSAPPNSMPTRPMTPRAFGGRCVDVASPPASPVAGSMRASAWGEPGGSSSARRRGFTDAGVSVCTTSGGAICCWGCSIWRAHSCACAFFLQGVGEAPRYERIRFACTGLVAALTGLHRYGGSIRPLTSNL